MAEGNAQDRIAHALTEITAELDKANRLQAMQLRAQQLWALSFYKSVHGGRSPAGYPHRMTEEFEGIIGRLTRQVLKDSCDETAEKDDECE